MATVNYSLRIDEADKQRAEEVFKALGMSFSTGMNIYIKMVGRQQQIPFNLSLDNRVATASKVKVSRSEKERAFNAINGVLSGYSVDLDQEREERILAK